MRQALFFHVFLAFHKIIKYTSLMNFKGKKLKKTFLYFLVLLIAGVFTYQISQAQTSPEWGDLGIGVRPLGMGGAFTAIANDSSAVYYNPAGLARIPGTELYFMGSNYHAPAMPYVGFGSISFPFFFWGIKIGVSWLRPYHVSPGLYDAKGTIVLDPNLAVSSGNHFEEDQIITTFATALNNDKTFYFGVNVKAMLQASNAQLFPALPNGSLTPLGFFGYGIDLGLIYRIPLVSYGREISFGFCAQNLATRVQYNNNNIEVPWPSQVHIGASYQGQDFIFGTRVFVASDMEFIGDAQYNSDVNKKWHMGIEDWMFHDRFALRGGYDTPLYTTGQYSLGTSIYLFGGAGSGGARADYAFLFSNPGQDLGESQWYSAFVRFTLAKEVVKIPTLSVIAKPNEFNPIEKEITTFHMSAFDETGIKEWRLSIADSSNVVVKTFGDIGHPPKELKWDGKDREGYNVMEGDYTYFLEATNYVDGTGVTPLQTLHILAPRKRVDRKTDLSQLQALLAEEHDIDENAERVQVSKAKEDLDTQVKILAVPPTPTYTPTYTNTPAPPTLEPTAAPYTPTPIMPFNNMGLNGMTSVFVGQNHAGQKAMVVDYQSEQTTLNPLLNEASRVVQTVAKDLGDTVAGISLRAHYGANVLTVDTPLDIARRLANGQLTTQQWLNSSNVNVNRESVKPSIQ